MKPKRVVVTGLGAVTPVGEGVDRFWAALISGENGIARVTHFDVSDYRSKLAGEVNGFDPREWLDAKSEARMDRFTQFALAAATMAFRDAGMDSCTFDATRAGIIIGSGIGGSQTIEEGLVTLNQKGPRGLSPFFVSKLLINTAACEVSIRFGLKGPLSALSVACSTGSNAIGDAFRIVQRGEADMMLAGGAEACVTPLAYGGFCATRSMSSSQSPETASRPFDKDRDGFVMGEGAGMVVVEERDHALNRDARIYAEIVGYGNTSDAYHLTAPDPEADGMARVMMAALEDASVDPAEVEYINAHGTSTVLNDKHESAAILRVFGDHATTLKVSSIKSMIGHLMAAAGAAEFVATAMSIHTGQIPPTINYHNPDPDCPLDYVTNGAEKINARIALTNSFGFGGGNACLVICRHEDQDTT